MKILNLGKTRSHVITLALMIGILLTQNTHIFAQDEGTKVLQGGGGYTNELTISAPSPVDVSYESSYGRWWGTFNLTYTLAFNPPAESSVRVEKSLDNGQTWSYVDSVDTYGQATKYGSIMIFDLGCQKLRAVLKYYGSDISTYSSDIEVCTKDPTLTGLRFPDVPDSTTPQPHIFADYIYNLADDNVVSGYPDGYFRPASFVTRGAMGKFIKNAYGFANDTSCGNFSDVPTSHTFYNEITTLKCRGVISGYPDGTFKPEENVDRGAAMKFVMQGLRVKHGNPNYLKYTGSAQRFTDVATTNTFYEYIMAATETGVGIVSGYPDGTFKPTVITDRGAMSKMVDNARNK